MRRARRNIHLFQVNDDGFVTEIIERNNERILPKTEENFRRASVFAEKVREEIGKLKGNSVLKGATVFFGGSNAEGLAVSPKTDFDISLILGPPYSHSNFDIHRIDGFFALEWDTSIQEPNYSDDFRFLRANDLRTKVFEELKNIIRRIKIPDAEIIWKKGVAAFITEIRYKEGNISLDLVPNIAFYSWNETLGLKPFQTLPYILQTYIESARVAASPTFLFTLAVPRKFKSNVQLCNISFAPLEKEFFKSEEKRNVRDMVCLVKIVAEASSWKSNLFFQSYLAKRVAIKNYESLKSLNVWDGYKALLEYFSTELESETIDGYFIKNQTTYIGGPDKANELKKDMRKKKKESGESTASLVGFKDVIRERDELDAEFKCNLYESWINNFVD